MSDAQSFWLYEAGIGENRAIYIENGELTNARVERDSDAVKVGAIVGAKFDRQWVAGISGIATLDGGQELLLQPLPPGLTEGQAVRVEIIREALNEKGGRAKRAKAKPADEGGDLTQGAGLLERIEASGDRVKQAHAHDKDLFAQYGWHEVMEQAETGKIDFEGGSLLIALTPAMTVIDVDGPSAPMVLAKRAAKEVAQAFIRLDITGNIGVDFPTLETKSERGEVCAVFDEYMSAKCERTAINGFGFMQIISRKVRPSLLETAQADKVLSAALQLLRQAERDRGTGDMGLHVHPAIAAKFSHRPVWLEELARRAGRKVSVEAKGSISINGGQIVSPT